ncbi:SCO family protein [Labrys wisconsinensis]|uniref:Protein SCO1/2 n=1 Tax=Labrys wisconsinensis TaxID=425677 RepID=A0ABU0JFL8_9HYPH|nr:SCO family protein [Labrys wisconsinensis]MDQ0473079.1 protein SCO1/2 [Labrys wisconsinensis]
MSSRTRMIAYAVWGATVLAVAVLALGYTQFGWFASSGPALTSSIGGPFTLVDQNGRAVTEKTFLGKPTAYFFGYTHCPDACPTTLMDMTDRLNALGPDGDKFNVVFISVDPERDTSALLKLYLESFDPRITAATGTPEAIASVIKAFHVYVRKVGEGDGYTFDHSTAVYLMNAKGDLVTLIDYQEARDAAIAKMRRALAS